MLKTTISLLLCVVLLCSCTFGGVEPSVSADTESTFSAESISQDAESSKPTEESMNTSENSFALNESSEAEENSKPEESSKPEEGSKPEEISKPEESSKPEEGSKPEETSKSEESTPHEESMPITESSAPEEESSRGEENSGETSTDTEIKNVKVAYIPLDNRPVNYQRVMWLAESVGIQLLMPDEQLFRGALDNMQPNKNGLTYGDRPALLSWLKEKEDECDYFIISLDQILSGGLVTSRWFSNEDLSFEYEVVDYISALSKRRHVILFDTVMRLASTVNYQGYTNDDYNAFRSYGMQERASLSGSRLNVENIIASYEYAPNGSKIPYSVSGEKMRQYLGARARKLRLADYILRNMGDSIDYCYVGVDDSHPGNTIQTNEIAYLNSILPKNRSIVYAGTDEFGMMCIARVCLDLYGSAKVNVRYFGGGEDTPADSFDYESLISNTHKKLMSLGCAESNDPDALQILISTNTYDKESAARVLLDAAKQNIKNGKPTVIIDPSSNNFVRTGLIDSDIPLTMLLGYSNWNTAGNALGLGLSMGISRYLYLNNADPTEESHDGFVKSMTFAYLKDISYKTLGVPMGDMSNTSKYSYSTILKEINASPMITNLNAIKTSAHGKVSVGNFRTPWNRGFEMVFDINVS